MSDFRLLFFFFTVVVVMLHPTPSPLVPSPHLVFNGPTATTTRTRPATKQRVHLWDTLSGHSDRRQARDSRRKSCGPPLCTTLRYCRTLLGGFFTVFFEMPVRTKFFRARDDSTTAAGYGSVCTLTTRGPFLNRNVSSPCVRTMALTL